MGAGPPQKSHPNCITVQIPNLPLSDLRFFNFMKVQKQYKFSRKVLQAWSFPTLAVWGAILFWSPTERARGRLSHDTQSVVCIAAFWLMIFSTYNEFIRISPHSKSRSFVIACLPSCLLAFFLPSFFPSFPPSLPSPFLPSFFPPLPHF